MLLIFTRYPREGDVKTRLIPLLGKTGACTLHQEMTMHTLNQLGSYPYLQVWYDGHCEKSMQDWLGAEYSYKRQPAGGLGEKMLYAFRKVFAKGEDKAILVGTDCPGINISHIEKAYSKLDLADVVIGPAEDGGYYLIGMKQADSRLFSGIHWGTDQVCEATVERARLAGLDTAFLETLADVDRPEDIHVWHQFRDCSSGKR